jgi:simple sugar transport system ATP-binding protein
MTTLLQMRGIHKRFGLVTALDNVDLTVQPGEILGLLGGNGAGKTTLMNVLFGLYKADAGAITVQGQSAAIRGPKDALTHGIGMVHQHFLQVNDFTVLENIVLGSPLRNWPRLQLATARQRVQALAQRFGLAVDPDAPLADLSMGVRQRVEILKALYRDARLLILDEPTTMLTPQEVDTLFQSLRLMVAQGVSVIFITHKLREVLAVCDRITVLRNGRSVLTLARETATDSALVQAMVGDALDVEASLVFTGERRGPPRQVVGDAAPLLVATGVTITDDLQLPAITDCSFAIGAGEILGLAGVAGNGQRELAEGLLGIRPLVQGQVTLGGQPVRFGQTAHLLANGVAYIPEARMADGFLPRASVAHNLILGQHRQPPHSNGPWLNWRQIVARARQQIGEFNIKTPGPHAVGANLSGGNIQRVLLARAFARPLKLLVAHNPTQGLDLPSIEFVYQKILAQRATGMATLLISENLDELFLLCDRLAVLYRGRIMGILDRDHFDAYTVGSLMSGAHNLDKQQEAGHG